MIILVAIHCDFAIYCGWRSLETLSFLKAYYANVMKKLTEHDGPIYVETFVDPNATKYWVGEFGIPDEANIMACRQFITSLAQLCFSRKNAYYRDLWTDQAEGGRFPIKLLEQTKSQLAILCLHDVHDLHCRLDILVCFSSTRQWRGGERNMSHSMTLQ